MEVKEKKVKSIMNQYEFYHKFHGVVVCTPYRLIKTYRLPKSSVYRLVNNETFQVKGWIMKENLHLYKHLTRNHEFTNDNKE